MGPFGLWQPSCSRRHSWGRHFCQGPSCGRGILSQKTPKKPLNALLATAALWYNLVRPETSFETRYSPHEEATRRSQRLRLLRGPLVAKLSKTDGWTFILCSPHARSSATQFLPAGFTQLRKNCIWCNGKIPSLFIIHDMNVG